MDNKMTNMHHALEAENCSRSVGHYSKHPSCTEKPPARCSGHGIAKTAPALLDIEKGSENIWLLPET
jgi:hypothetical protein